MFHHTAKPIRAMLEALDWEDLPHAAYLPDLGPSDYHQFTSTHLPTSALIRTKMWKNGSKSDSQQKGKIFTGVVFTNCPKGGINV